MSAFQITANGVHVAYVEADTPRSAKAYARKTIEARPLSVAEVVALTRDGKAITAVDTGVAVGSEPQG